MKYHSIFFILCLDLIFFVKTSNAETQKIFKKIYSKKINHFIELKVEVARSFKERTQGLMYRKHFIDSQGMLFINPKNSYATFWMKNTYMPLDIIFIHKNKKITQIYENARPFDLKPIRSYEPVCYILEVPAGYVKLYDMQVYDQLSWD